MKALTARLAALVLLATAPLTLPAQHAGHDHHPAPAKAVAKPAAKPAKKVVRKPAAKPAAKPAKKPATPAATPPSTPRTSAAKPASVDHAAMGHAPATPTGTAAPAPAAVDHSAMDHATVDHAAMDHAAMGQGTTDAATHDHAAMDHAVTDNHATMDHAAMGHAATDHVDHAAMNHGTARDLPADAAPRTPIPTLSEADRAAAFPAGLHAHEVHDQRVFSYWLFDRLEWQDTDDGQLGWEGVAWIGGDIHRLWLRTEGEANGGEVESANAEVLYGRGVTAWWDVVAGVRHDFGHGPSRTYAAFGVQGLAPYKFEVEATVFAGAHGRGGVALEAEYDTLVTNRLILQWTGEATLHAKDDPEIGVGAGLSTIEAGARLRYEFSRRFAPYVGVEFERAFGDTAAVHREDGEPTRDTRVVAGIRFWF